MQSSFCPTTATFLHYPLTDYLSDFYFAAENLTCCAFAPLPSWLADQLLQINYFNQFLTRSRLCTTERRWIFFLIFFILFAHLCWSNFSVKFLIIKIRCGHGDETTNYITCRNKLEIIFKNFYWNNSCDAGRPASARERGRGSAQTQTQTSLYPERGAAVRQLTSKAERTSGTRNWTEPGRSSPLMGATTACHRFKVLFQTRRFLIEMFSTIFLRITTCCCWHRGSRPVANSLFFFLRFSAQPDCIMQRNSLAK